MNIGSLLLPAVLLVGDAIAQDGMDMRYLVRQGSVALGVNPLTPSTRKAFYVARGLSEAEIRPYADACGFSFGMRNASDHRIEVTLSDWQVFGADGARIAFTPTEAWDTRWEKAGVPPAARIAFKWAQFQTENVFEPGDWIMGMATLRSNPKPPFRLIARYHDSKGNHEIVLESLECAHD
jgi:hypothetical protein